MLIYCVEKECDLQIFRKFIIAIEIGNIDLMSNKKPEFRLRCEIDYIPKLILFEIEEKIARLSQNLFLICLRDTSSALVRNQ